MTAIIYLGSVRGHYDLGFVSDYIIHLQEGSEYWGFHIFEKKDEQTFKKLDGEYIPRITEIETKEKKSLSIICPPLTDLILICDPECSEGYKKIQKLLKKSELDISLDSLKNYLLSRGPRLDEEEREIYEKVLSGCRDIIENNEIDKTMVVSILPYISVNCLEGLKYNSDRLENSVMIINRDEK